MKTGDIKDCRSAHRILRSQSGFFISPSKTNKKTSTLGLFMKEQYSISPLWDSQVGTPVGQPPTISLLSNSTRRLSFELRLSQLLIIPHARTETRGVKVNIEANRWSFSQKLNLHLNLPSSVKNVGTHNLQPVITIWQNSLLTNLNFNFLQLDTF